MLRTCLDFISQLRPESLRRVLTLSAVLVAAQICYIQHGWINNDTVLYMESARLFAQGQWQEGFKVFAWPLYALLIAGVHLVTTFSLHLSAQLLSVAFYAATTYCLIRLIILAGGDNLAVAAGALILFSASYVTGDVMQMLMRDQGFWAFLLAGLMFFIRFFQTHRWRDALLWQACIILATLFRIEGISYLIGLPLVLLLERGVPPGQRLRWLLKAEVLPVSGALLLAIAFQLNQQLQMQDLGRLTEVFSRDLLDQFTEQFRQRSQIMADQVLGKFLDGFATQGLLLTFAFVIISKILSTTGLINTGLAAYSVARGTLLKNRRVILIMAAALIIGLFNAQWIIVRSFVLSGRYIVAIALLLMIFAALGLATLAREAGASGTRNMRSMLAWGLLIFMGLSLIKNLLPKADGYNYQQKAVAWLAQKHVPHERVYYHDGRLRYYAGAPFAGKCDDCWALLENQVARDRLSNYRYLVVNVDREDAARIEKLRTELAEFREVSRFYGSKNKKYTLILAKGEPGAP